MITETFFLAELFYPLWGEKFRQEKSFHNYGLITVPQGRGGRAGARRHTPPDRSRPHGKEEPRPIDVLEELAMPVLDALTRFLDELPPPGAARPGAG